MGVLQLLCLNLILFSLCKPAGRGESIAFRRTLYPWFYLGGFVATNVTWILCLVIIVKKEG